MRSAASAGSWFKPTGKVVKLLWISTVCFPYKANAWIMSGKFCKFIISVDGVVLYEVFRIWIGPCVNPDWNYYYFLALGKCNAKYTAMSRNNVVLLDPGVPGTTSRTVR